MQPSEVTAAPPEIVAEVLTDPAAFLAAAEEAAPGWAARYGGAEGVVELTSVLQEQLAAQAKLTSELRTAALAYLRTHRGRTLESIGQQLGITRVSVRRAAVRQGDSTGTFSKLDDPATWTDAP